MDKIHSVTEVNEYIKGLMDDDFVLSQIFIRGQISNYKRHSSGHHYFSLKDENGVISAVMFKFDALKVRIKLEDGMQIIAFGRVSSFVKSGQYQLYIKEIQADGIGDLHLAFDQLKNKLYKEGLFDQNLKQELPRFPEKIAIVTAKTGAAVQDMLRILKNRYKLAEILVYSVKVQGEGAENEIAYAINYINNLNLADVIIIGRGGGSIEDLWAFNSEMLAHTIFASNIPVISAVGHEPDFTISDFVADVRASTPSNAAEIVVPDATSVKSFLQNAQNIMDNAIKTEISEKRTQVLKLKVLSPNKYIDEKRIYIDFLTSKLKNPKILVENYRNRVNLADKTIKNAYKMNLSKKRQKTVEIMAYIDGYSPMKVLSRGFGYSLDENEKIIKSVKKVKISQEITTKYSDGVIKSKILEIKED
ncbi:MAG: exodeoxyribonuclease VII large subunit [Clostridia bacterium]